MVGFEPQMGHSGFLRSFNSRNFIWSASNTSNRPISVSSFPSSSLSVSIAWIEPMIPGRTPSTPPSAQDGTSPGGGGWEYRQRSEEHTSKLQSHSDLVCRLLLE